uniref:Uncharacterized protein n=1 Tax=Ditylum brightwellii TaxID=49249 RepID=A0A7S4RFB1_9STRA
MHVLLHQGRLLLHQCFSGSNFVGTTTQVIPADTHKSSQQIISTCNDRKMSLFCHSSSNEIPLHKLDRTSDMLIPMQTERLQLCVRQVQNLFAWHQEKGREKVLLVHLIRPTLVASIAIVGHVRPF